MTRKEDVVVFSYYDCIIRESDLKILQSNGWLNDAIISFYFVYLEQELFRNHNELLFIGPEVTQCLKESPSSEIPIFLDPLEAQHKDFIFMAVNDSGKSAGGSHWSLLVYNRLENKFYHLDSSSHTNYQPALKLARNVGNYFSPSSEVNLEEMTSLQQDNSYDCGIYLICNLENLAHHVTTHGHLEQVPFIKKDIVVNMRNELLEIISEQVEKSKNQD
ncbi:sentrin-specific protease 8-like [Macrosteles quadrilineatus]|uniref:sentrin-specific protease 8-like n=1 Tax=Macrosteles quadrilineatus TaxID=74068 RepID=UPI0023E13480|nr:sentrin-specific protease 8-like [Macrosteles quadrilineatus]